MADAEIVHSAVSPWSNDEVFVGRTRRPVMGEWGESTLSYDLPDWSLAACREQDEFDFAQGLTRGSHFSSPSAIAMKAICRACPIVDACGDYALEMEGTAGVAHRSGIFGGMDALDRTLKRDARGVAA